MPALLCSNDSGGGEPGEHRTAPLESDQHIISRSAIVLYVTTPQLTKCWQALLVRELHENRERTEVPGPELAAWYRRSAQ